VRRYPPPKTGTHTGWSPGRNRGLQAKFRRLVLRRDDYTCRHCGGQDLTGRTLEAHHIQAGYTVECGVTLHKGECHRAWDPYAR
jgi:hypothetical protein